MDKPIILSATPNVKLKDVINKYTKKRLISELKSKNLPYSGDRQTLINILNSYDHYSLNEIKYVYGPNNVIYLQHPHKKQFMMLFGETHLSYTEKCGDLNSVEIAIYLKKLIEKYSKIQFDIYMEYKYSNLESKYKNFSFKSQSGTNIKQSFDKCIIDYSMCPYKNIRIHLSDIRTGMETNIDIITLTDIYTFIKKSDMTNTKNVNIIKDEMKNFNVNMELYTRDKRRILELIHKEIMHIDPIFSKYMINIVNDLKPYTFFYTLKENINYMIKELKNYDIKKEKQYYLSLLDNIGNDITHNHIMDIYTISRMLHKFPTDYPKNIIFYGGSNHMRTISSFFISLGYKELFRGDLGMVQCVDVIDVDKFLVS